MLATTKKKESAGGDLEGWLNCFGRNGTNRRRRSLAHCRDARAHVIANRINGIGVAPVPLPSDYKAGGSSRTTEYFIFSRILFGHLISLVFFLWDPSPTLHARVSLALRMSRARCEGIAAFSDMIARVRPEHSADDPSVPQWKPHLSQRSQW
jgi:hypothetical protein